MLKRYLLAGLLIWAPLGITIWVLQLIVGTLDQSLLLLPPSWRPDALIGFHVPGFGVILSLLILLATGMVGANLFGQQLLRWWEGLVNRIPIVRSIYSSVKQVSDTMLSSSGNAFRQAVLVEFPQRGHWSIAFLVGPPGPRVTRDLAGEHVAVYVPTAPNPTSGYTIIVPTSDVRELDITVDEALKFVISLGVVAPAARVGNGGGRPGGFGDTVPLDLDGEGNPRPPTGDPRDTNRRPPGGAVTPARPDSPIAAAGPSST